MKRRTLSELAALVDPGRAKERVMIEWLHDEARKFYADPKNAQAFEAQNKEDMQHDT